jgi:N-acetylgalactosamine-N,N'-diacetylbacillosaminyl-diphospho-undecaprenol 4-alpha-N-acetylgalactosaminyltransferase
MENYINYPIPENQIIHILPGGSFRVLNFIKVPLLAFRLKKYLIDNDISTVFSLLILPNLILTFLKKCGWKGKAIISERTMSSLRYNSETIKGIVLSNLIKYLYPYADLIIPNSKGVKYGLEKILKIHNQYNVIYNPIDIELTNTLSKIELLNFEQVDLFTFICVGNFFNYKNQILLINAFYRINNLECRLILIGKGPELVFIKKRIDELDLSEKVFLIGSHPNPYQYLAFSDCFVSSSNLEGFPNAILEALAIGLPVIATDCQSGPREILAPYTDTNIQLENRIEYAEYGILVPVNNDEILSEAMSQIYCDSKLRNQYKSKALIRANDFNIDKIISHFKNLFDD